MSPPEPLALMFRLSGDGSASEDASLALCGALKMPTNSAMLEVILPTYYLSPLLYCAELVPRNLCPVEIAPQLPAQAAAPRS